MTTQADVLRVSAHAHLVGSGVQPLVDAVKDAGGDPGDLRTVVWQATWARGYEDVVAPTPVARLKAEGFVVFARATAADQYATVIDTSHALWAIVVHGPQPAPGARVRIVTAFSAREIGWQVNILEEIGLGLSIRFGQKLDENTDWIDRIREALGRIGIAEADRRKAIVAERRMLITAEPVKPLRDEINALHEELRVRVDAETAGTPEERLAFQRGNERKRKAIIEECKLRRHKRYEEEVALLRARMPELQAEHERRTAALSELRAAVTELEDAASRSRGVTERLSFVEGQLDAIASAGLLVTADLDVLEALGAADFEEVARTVQLLFDLIPSRTSKR